MIRNTGIGTVLLASLVLAAALAPSAMAEEFHSESSPTIVEGAQVSQVLFTTNTGASVKCGSMTYKGTMTGTFVSMLTLHPEYSECTFNNEAATVSTTGCADTIHEHILWMLWTRECTPTNKVKIVTTACTLEIGSQSSGGGVTVTNEGSGASRDMLMKLEVTGVTFTKSGSPLLCAFAGKEGSYSGSVTLKGYQDEGGSKGAQVGIWWE